MAVRTRHTTPPKQPSIAGVGLVDCDIHNAPASEKLLRKYMPERWVRHLDRWGSRQRHGVANGFPYPKATPAAARVDAWPPSGGPPGSDLAFMRAQHLDPLGIEWGILNCLHGTANELNLDLAAALASAVNDWQAAEWLEPEPRLRGSIVIPADDAGASAAEIARVMKHHRGFVQALLLVRTSEPLGRRRYRPIFEACVEHGLPLGIHFGGYGGSPTTSSGWPSYYIEDHSGMAQSFQAQVVSLVLEGVFEQFPSLQVVLIEGGLAWAPSLMWRMDRLWTSWRDEVPALRRPPSSYLRSNFWLTTQPVEEPEVPAHLLDTLGWMDMSDRLLFATDYPHWDFDDPARAFPVRLPDDLHRRIYSANARALYRLPAG